MVINLVFYEHPRKSGSDVFCVLKENIICLNSKFELKSDDIEWRETWIEKRLSHEVIHLILYKLEGEETSHEFDKIDPWTDLSWMMM